MHKNNYNEVQYMVNISNITEYDESLNEKSVVAGSQSTLSEALNLALCKWEELNRQRWEKKTLSSGQKCGIKQKQEMDEQRARKTSWNQFIMDLKDQGKF